MCFWAKGPIIEDEFQVPGGNEFQWQRLIVCSGSVVVTAYDFESGRPGSNPDWGPIYSKASITAQGLWAFIPPG